MHSTIARPYAVAVFEFAKIENTLEQWSDFLATLTLVIADKAMQAVIVSPKYSGDDLQQLLLAVLVPSSAVEQNLIKLLIKNKRLAVVTTIATQFENLRAEYENRTAVSIISAYELSKSEINNIAKILEKNLGGSVEISTKVDDSLLGGVVIRVGDMVINASVLGKLEQFANKIVV